MARRYDDAIVQFRKVLRMAPDLPFAHFVLSVIFFHKAMYEESLAEMKGAYNSTGDREVEEALTQGYAQSGYRGAMRRAADLLAARFRENVNPLNLNASDIATLYVMAGDEAHGLAWLERGLEVRDPNMPSIRLFPPFETLRNTPRFQTISRRMNLPR